MEPATVLPRERISIALLMLWTTMSAVLLAIDRATDSGDPNRVAGISKWVALAYAPIFGAGMSALALAIFRYLTDGPRFPSQPGHWVLMIAGILSLGSIFLRVIVLSTRTPFGFNYHWYVLLRIITLLTSLVLFELAVRAQRDHWRIVFRLNLVVSTVVLLALLLELVSGSLSRVFRFELYLTWLPTTAMTIAAIVDRVRRTPRDDLHWAGIIIRFLHQLLVTAIPLLIWLLYQP